MTTLRKHLSVSLAAATLGGILLGCTTHLLGGADAASLRDANALESQLYKDEADDGGVPKAVLRAEAKREFCAVRDVLRRSSAQDDAGALSCGSGK